MRGRPRQAGVSLLETMIALAMMAMLAIILSSGLGSSARVIVSSSDMTRRVDVMLARRNLRSWMEAALASPFPGQAKGGLSGTKNSLSFSFVSETGEFWPGDAAEVSLASNQKGEIELVARGSQGETHKISETRQLMSLKPAHLKIEYFGHVDPEAPISWLEKWPSTAGSPELVRITITDESLQYPPLTIRVGKAIIQREMSLSSLLPPALPSRP